MVKRDIDTWEVRYSKYVGDLSVFDKKIYNIESDKLHTNQIKDGVFITVDASNHLMMIEIRDADKVINGIDKMNKSSILNTVKECIA